MYVLYIYDLCIYVIVLASGIRMDVVGHSEILPDTSYLFLPN